MTTSPNQLSRQATPGRIESLDQFRGYCVFAMFVVNFAGHFQVVPRILKHNHTFFSFADSIMPAFLFAVGISFRLTWIKRSAKSDQPVPRWPYVRRCLLLMLISLVIYGAGPSLPAYKAWTWPLLVEKLARLVKADLWEVLALIGAAQVIVLPMIGASVVRRAGFFVALIVSHVGLSAWFNFAFVHGRPNWLDAWLGTTGVRAWDGGLFGLLNWAALVLIGTLFYDLVLADSTSHSSFAKGWYFAVPLLVCGFALSQFSSLYPNYPAATGERRFAAYPVRFWKEQDETSGAVRTSKPRPWLESPFQEPPLDRPWNYWMLSKRTVGASFILFGAGCSMLTYALFIAACDQRHKRIDVLGVLGRNALTAYATHHLVLVVILDQLPSDAPWWLVGAGFLAFWILTYGAVSYLDRKQIHIRL